jgi:hypothetical protein
MGTVASERVFLHNVINLDHSNIILNHSRNKPLLRLNFNKPGHLSIGVIGEDKKDSWIAIERLDDILQHAEAVRHTARAYL